MDSHPSSSDTIGVDDRDHRLLTAWDDLLVCVRSSPGHSAVDAALLASRPHDSSTSDIGAPEAQADHARPFTPPGGAPTWDGLHEVIAILRRKNLLPESLSSTRSPTVMLTRLLDELALIFAGHRGPRPRLGVDGAGSAVGQAQMRFESACITWAIAGRLRLKAVVPGPLKGYLDHGELMPEISRDRVLQAVDAIEGLFGGACDFAEMIRHEEPSLFEFDARSVV
jgi:hypothetical protein